MVLLQNPESLRADHSHEQQVNFRNNWSSWNCVCEGGAFSARLKQQFAEVSAACVPFIKPSLFSTLSFPSDIQSIFHPHLQSATGLTSGVHLYHVLMVSSYRTSFLYLVQPQRNMSNSTWLHHSEIVYRIYFHMDYAQCLRCSYYGHFYKCKLDWLVTRLFWTAVKWIWPPATVCSAQIYCRTEITAGIHNTYGKEYYKPLFVRLALYMHR